jgi:phosphoserine phosphatase
MRANGAYTALVSGGFTVFTGPISRTLGFDEHRSNTLAIEDGRRSPARVAEPILGREAKLEALRELTARLGLPTEEQTLAVGDGANDLAMIEAAGLGVAFRAKPAVAEAAEVRHRPRRPDRAALPPGLRMRRLRHGLTLARD